MITHDSIPCWYELLWRGEDRGIVLRIHKDFADKVKPIPTNAPIVKHYARDFGFKTFGREFGKDFGFENSLKFLGEAGGFLEYSIPTPLVRKPTGKTCRSCRGTGQDENLERECLFCDGKGKEIVYDYTEAFAISASLTTLFELMMFPEIETGSNLSQLICVHTVAMRGPHGSSLSAELSREAMVWFKQHGPCEIPEMVSAMRVVWKKMEGRIQDFYDYSFRANLSDNNGWLCVDCPGEACGLHPSNRYPSGGNEGFEISCHNVDSPLQQFTLLASLAALHGLVRRDVKVV